MKQRSIVILMASAIVFILTFPAMAECPGDFDCDGDVDGQDLVVVASDFGDENCGSCATTVNIEIYRPVAGLEKTIRVRRFTDQAPWFNDQFIMVRASENASTWIMESGYYNVYYDDRDETYDPLDVLVRTCTHNPPGPKTLSDGLKRIGDTWGGGYTTTCDDSELSYINLRKYTLLGIEDVTVPGGTFQNCLKIYRDRGNNSPPSIHWYAPGMGWIKRIYEGLSSYEGGIYEMTSYQMID